MTCLKGAVWKHVVHSPVRGSVNSVVMPGFSDDSGTEALPRSSVLEPKSSSNTLICSSEPPAEANGH